MILLDTNVISELMKPRPSQAVLDWFAAQGTQRLVLSVITVAELRYGVACLPQGRRRRALDEAVTGMLDEDFEGAILPFDLAAAEAYGMMAAQARQAGRTPGQSDLMIAATALVHAASVATRNLRDFDGAGIDLYNPFED
ncbi:type II toxin-antitoxin system VapC family toxin [Thalassococcus sp. S3]|uniref:type II toxin-antitoxin system VapC family toxin n=1 Tax=Thalassococcus sp. S3 TaxID=2017482 RepID=UPI001023F6FB|nr:type II toxin-antitoxin system VapC family toxin [Thalassococcus sp. S3]QBF34235.1 VapC toxin family PIN domain ribonuclease [Thalassococcus sp. S3]